MYKERLKGFIAGILVMVLISSTVVFAGGVMREIHYGVNVVVNGRQLQLEGIDRPFIMDGRTFLPASVIAQALGASSQWNAETFTVYINSPTTVTPQPMPTPAPQPTPPPISMPEPLFEVTSVFERGGDLQLATINMLGNPFPNTLRTRQAPWSSANVRSGWEHRNIDRQYNIITGTIGRIDGSATRGISTISFIGDGRTLAAFNVDGDTLPTDISVNVTGVQILRIQIDQPPASPWIAFTNAMIR